VTSAPRPMGAETEEAATTRLGRRLRETRRATGMSVREMARRVNVSPSFISQVELGRAAPSIGTLYAIASELQLSLDSLMDGSGAVAAPAVAPPVESVPTEAGPRMGDLLRDHSPLPMSGEATRDGAPSYVQRADERPVLMLGEVVWERLTAQDDPNVEFLRITYPPGSESCTRDNLMHHNGWEYGHVLCGRMDVQVSFHTDTLGPGDSIDFDSTRPHRLSNPHPETCIAIWVVVGRQRRG
jgi:transcriptional regulator with XRE-family HTH domain